MIFKPLLAAAALLASGSASGTDVPRPPRADRPPVEITDAQKAAFAQAKTLFEAGKADEAKQVLADAGIKAPPFVHGRGADARPPMHEGKDLTDAQKAALEKARALHEAGDVEGAKKVIEEAGLPGRGLKAGWAPGEGRGMGMMKFRDANEAK